MLHHQVSFTRSVLHFIASGIALGLLTLLAKALGFLDDPDSFKMTMSIVSAIWLVIWLVLYVVIT